MEELTPVLQASEKAVDNFLNNPTKDRLDLLMGLNNLAIEEIKRLRHEIKSNSPIKRQSTKAPSN